MNLINNNLPLVSIVAINFNNSKYVVETLDSIGGQNYPNTELIIVDDCSTDDSVQKIEEWLKSYQRPFKFIKSKKNQGVCSTINKGYKESKGVYISSIATDDVMLPDKIQKQVAFFESLPDEVGMIYSDAFLIDDKSNELFGTFIPHHRKFDNVPSGNIFNDLLEGNFIPAMSTMIKSSIIPTIGYFDEELLYEDYDMWLRIGKHFKIIFQTEIAVKYRKRKTSLSSVLAKDWPAQRLKIIAKHANNEIAKKQLDISISQFYLDGYPIKELLKYSNLFNNNLISHRCIKFRVPYNFVKSMLVLFKRL
jgi:glycosyltransferase involved in cell wall biosynthesis